MPDDYVVENDVSGAYGDKALLRHVLANLLSNAVKYSPADVAVQFRICRKGSDAIFTVKNSGIGIPKQIKHTSSKPSAAREM